MNQVELTLSLAQVVHTARERCARCEQGEGGCCHVGCCIGRILCCSEDDVYTIFRDEPSSTLKYCGVVQSARAVLVGESYECVMVVALCGAVQGVDKLHSNIKFANANVKLSATHVAVHSL
jgi:hypothetical protein